jgi:hypothetical protein
MGQPKKKIITVPTFLAALYGKFDRNKDAKLGKESGLNHEKLFADIQAREFFFDPEPSRKILGFGRGGVKEAIERTVKACYPELG